jgi:hypothetical protein
MILPDVNVLVHAFRSDFSDHNLCRSWLDGVVTRFPRVSACLQRRANKYGPVLESGLNENAMRLRHPLPRSFLLPRLLLDSHF